MLFFKDTDSLILFHQRGLHLLSQEKSSKLGEMTNVIQEDYGVGCFGDKFFASSAKSYGLRIRSKKDRLFTKWHSRHKGKYLQV